MLKQLTDDDYRCIRSEYPNLSGHECLGLVSHRKQKVLEVLFVKTLPEIGMEVAFVLDEKGHFSLYNKINSAGIIINGEGSYSIKAPIIQDGFSLKGGGRLYELAGLKINNDHYGNLLYQYWTF